MSETSNALRTQATNAIAECTRLDQMVAAAINIASGSDTLSAEFQIENLRTLHQRLRGDALLIQKLQQKIEKLERELFNA